MKLEAKTRLSATSLSKGLRREFLYELAKRLGGIVTVIGDKLAVSRKAPTEDVISKIESLGWSKVHSDRISTVFAINGAEWPITYVPGTRNIFMGPGGDLLKDSPAMARQAELLKAEIQRILKALPNVGKVKLQPFRDTTITAVGYKADATALKRILPKLGYRVVQSPEDLSAVRQDGAYQFEIDHSEGFSLTLSMIRNRE